MFRRKSDDPAPSPGDQPRTAGVPSTATAQEGAPERGAAQQPKGRPTPSRRDAEAARKARAKSPRSRKGRSREDRAKRAESSQRVRAGIKAGDERYLPPRDQGPVRRFVRDLVDVRFSIGEVMIPLMLVTLVLGYSGNPRLASIGNTILLFTLLVVVLDLVVLRFRLRRALRERFPDESPKGTTFYAFTRALQLRFMRLPKTQVRIGQALPDRYR